MSSCPDICTADKCRELENRIEILEQRLSLLEASFLSHLNQDIPKAHDFDTSQFCPQNECDSLRQDLDLLEASFESHTQQNIPTAHDFDTSQFCPQNECDSLRQNLDLLEASFESHTQQDIPTAHNYTPSVNVNTSISNDTLIIDVSVDDQNDNASVNLPTPKLPVNIEASVINNTLKINVTVGSEFDFAQVNLPMPELDVNVNALTIDDTLFIDVSVGDQSDYASVNLPVFQSLPVDVDVDINSQNQLLVSVKVGDQRATDLANLPQLPESNLNLSGYFQNGILTLRVSDGQSADTANIPIFITDFDLDDFIKDIFDRIVDFITDLFDNNRRQVDVQLNIDENNILFVTVAVGQDNDTGFVQLPTLESLPVNVNALTIENTLFIDVKVGDKSDYASVNLPIPIIPELPVNVNASIISETLFLDITVGDKSDFTSVNLLQLPQPDLNLSGFFQDDILTLEVSNGDNSSSEEIVFTMPECDLSYLERLVEEIHEEILADVLDSIKTDYQCTFPIDEQGNVIPTYAESTKTEITFSGKSILGIYKYLDIIAQNLDAIHTDVCKAIDPIVDIYRNDLYQYCEITSINREDFPEGSSGDEDYLEAIEAAKIAQYENSKYGYLLNQDDGTGKLFSAPNNWTNRILQDFSVIQSRIAKDQICKLQEPDVVSLVASPKYVTNIDGKVLVLHFVTFDNYPKRKKGSTYRAIQIPAAFEEYDWSSDFQDLTWTTGNQYAELELVGYRARVSGWFASKSAADNFFDYVLAKLTTAVEQNRKYPEHKNPRTDINQVTERPYRAFIESVNEQGQAICHVKYIPVVEE